MQLKHILRGPGLVTTQTILTDDLVTTASANNPAKSYTFGPADFKTRAGVCTDINITARISHTGGQVTVQYRLNTTVIKSFIVDADTGNFFGCVMHIENPNEPNLVEIYVLDASVPVDNVTITGIFTGL